MSQTELSISERVSLKIANALSFLTPAASAYTGKANRKILVEEDYVLLDRLDAANAKHLGVRIYDDKRPARVEISNDNETLHSEVVETLGSRVAYFPQLALPPEQDLTLTITATETGQQEILPLPQSWGDREVLRTFARHDAYPDSPQ